MKKNLLTLILLITAVCWSNKAFAQPANNECSGAEFIAGAEGNLLPFGPYDNTEATSEASDPADPGFPDASIDNTTWYTLIGDGNTYFIYTNDTCSGFNLTDTYLTDGDSQIAVYTGGCDALELLTLDEDNLHVPDYDINGHFPAGVVLETEVGVEYSIMVDGFAGSAGEFCIVVTDWACEANIELAEGQETSMTLCVGDDAAIAINDATLNFGGASIGVGLNYAVAWQMTGTDPMGEHPRFLDSFLGFVGTDFIFSGQADGTDPFGFGLDCIWLTPTSVAEITGSGSAFLAFDCQAVGAQSIEVCFEVDGEGDCADAACADANVDLADGIELSYELCPGEAVNITPNEETINYGALVGEFPAYIFVVNTEDPMGDPLGTPGSLFLPSEITNTNVEGDPRDTLWVTLTLFENLHPEDPNLNEWICQPLSETVQIILLAEGDPACAEVECGIGEGDVGELTADGETTVCVGDGEPDVVNFTTSYTPDGAVDTRTITLMYDASSGVSGLAGADKVYIHSGAGSSGPGAVWEHCVGNWGMDDGVGEMTSMGGDMWSITINYDDYYANPAYNAGNCSGGVMAAGATVYDIGVVFRNAAGDATGKDDSDQDIFIRGLDTDNPTVEQADGSAFAGVTVQFASAATAQYGYLVTTDTGDILSPGVVEGTEFSQDFEGAPAGVCLVWGVIWEGDVAGAFVQGGNALAIAESLPIDACIDITDPIEIIREECEEICPMVVEINEVCEDEEGGTVFVTITGGEAPYTIIGTFSDTDDDGVFDFPSPENETYEIEISDGSGCDVVLAVGVLTCSKCKNVPGTLSAGANGATGCGADGSVSVEVSADGFVDTNPENPEVVASVRHYILHTDADDPEGSEIARNTTGEFTRSDAGGAGTYYITTVVGPDEDGDGFVDSYEYLGLLGNECSFDSEPLAITFADETDLTLTIQEDCDEETEMSTVNVTITGGGDGATYNVTGTISLVATDGVEFSIGDVADEETYTISVAQIDGCGVADSTSAPVICQKEDAVEWLSFEGEVQTEGNFLQWATASETNNEYFSVERSLDGKNFVEIATVAAVGESFTPTSYSHLDRSAPAGISYYRITQYDFDGQNDATNVISLIRGEGAFGITNIRPVPAADYVEIAFTAINNGSIELTVYDMTGRVMLQSNVETSTGINVRSIDVSTYPAGVYMISVNNGTEVATQRLVKE